MNKIFSKLNTKSMRFILVGIVNTVFGYLIGAGLFILLNGLMELWAIGVLSYFVSTIFTYINYRYLVFKFTGNVF